MLQRTREPCYTKLTRFVARGLWVLLAMLIAIRKLLKRDFSTSYDPKQNSQKNGKGLENST